MTTFKERGGAVAFAGNYIPAHDQTIDLAEEIGERLDAFQAYITEVRDAEQAHNATVELLSALLTGRCFDTRLIEPGPHQPGSTGETDAAGRMTWRWNDDPRKPVE